MVSVIFDPLQEYDQKFKELHRSNTQTFFDELVARSGVDIEQNRETVRRYEQSREELKKLNTKLNWLRFWRVLMCITIVLIPLVILKMTPKIRALRAEIQEADTQADRLLEEAKRQMQPLNALFTDRDALRLIEKTLPLLRFESYFSVRQEADMQINYDFREHNDDEESTVDVLAGYYNENPFLFENKRIHTMGMETYHGYKTIHWTETYMDSDGKMKTRSKSQTLHATVRKPKPFYSTQVVLNYCCQGGPDLSFSRDATHLDRKSEREIQRLVKRGERKLERKEDQAVRENDDFTSMANTEFEVLFDALDRTDEVQFRTLFTPLAQTNMVSLILSKIGYGDDFNFIKNRRTNRIVTKHSQGRPINLLSGNYHSYSFDVIRQQFVGKNTAFFKAVYFDFAPLWAIPIYQERPVHSLKPIPQYDRLYAYKECEALANAVPDRYVVHPSTKTEAILKSAFVENRDRIEQITVTAFSYDIKNRVDYVSVHGGDGFWHDVPVEWDEYISLEQTNSFGIAAGEAAEDRPIIASRNGLCIFDL